MQRVGSREFKNRLGRYLRAIRKGQTLLITDRGKPVARVSPPDQNGDSELTFSELLKKLEAEGKMPIQSQIPTRPETITLLSLSIQTNFK